MNKIDNSQKQEIVGGIFASTIITLLGIGFGALNIIGSTVTGAMNINESSKVKETSTWDEKPKTNSIFTNSAKVNYY
ncbi:MAG: hypothetical protein ACRC4M_03980 [Mycoplasma sp.]